MVCSPSGEVWAVIIFKDGDFDRNVEKFGEGKVKSPLLNEDLEDSREIMLDK